MDSAVQCLNNWGLGFKNLSGQNLPVRAPLYKNLFSLKFETGFYSLRSVQTILNNWANKSTFRILFGNRCLVTPTAM